MAHLRNKAAASALGVGPPVTSSTSAATLPSYFTQQQTTTPTSTAAVAAAAMIPPKLANGRVGYKAASSEDYGTGERDREREREGGRNEAADCTSKHSIQCKGLEITIYRLEVGLEMVRKLLRVREEMERK